MLSHTTKNIILKMTLQDIRSLGLPLGTKRSHGTAPVHMSKTPQGRGATCTAYLASYRAVRSRLPDRHTEIAWTTAPRLPRGSLCATFPAGIACADSEVARSDGGYLHSVGSVPYQT